MSPLTLRWFQKKKDIYIHIVTNREKIYIERNDNDEANGQHVNKWCV